MGENLGERLVREGLVARDQVDRALLRQKLQGGRLGQNLVELGSISKADLETFFRHRPRVPASVQDTGLTLDHISELALKIIFLLNSFRLADVCARLRLPAGIVDEAIQSLRRDKLCEVKGGTGYESISYTYSVTSQGRQRARELMEKSRYAGPAPVALDEYTRMFEYQSARNSQVSEAELMKALSPYVINERLFAQLGPAVNSGKSIFLYGPAGNGKTVIAEALGTLLGEDIYIPHAVCVDDEIIRIYDPISHKPAAGEGADGDHDQRWVLCKRPMVLVGGELTLGMLDLDFNPATNYYEAPFQMKANGGVLIIDDFGRQMVRPRDLLNRWIVPLERRADFLTLHTGKKFDIPFEMLVIFSTNIEPRELVDEAFLRRIRYKIKIDHPTKDEYHEIFRRLCRGNGIEYVPEFVEYLLAERYEKAGVSLNACHPRDIIEQIVDISRYRRVTPVLSRENVDEAWRNYFVDI